ncbi:MAG: DUF389 domain-containing protein [Micromonosporaceae bacterium]
MLHLRIISPADQSDRVAEALRASPEATHLIVLPGAARQPRGDVVLCDVPREAASPVLERLRELGIDGRGAIAVDEVSVSLSAAARRATDQAPGLPEDAVVWEEVEEQTGDAARLSVTYLVFLTVAVILADRPLTSFIWRPDGLTWVVGLLAGVAGMLSLTTAKSSPLVGVLISVTTVPAAGNAAVAVAYGVAEEALGAAAQLLVNLAAIVIAGVLTLLVQHLRRRRTELR